MNEFPKIQRAIPKKRYQMGEFGVTVLGEIESPDIRAYQFIMAFVPEGAASPVLYICAERTAPKDRHDGSHQLRVINHAMSEVMDIGDQWRDLETFCDEGLKLGAQVLGLKDEQAIALL